MSLFASIRASAGTLSAFERALEVTQENVANASTPGFARQTISLRALPFDPVEGLMGGVEATAVLSSRSDFAEAQVRREVSLLGYSEAKAQALAGSELVLDATGEAGIPAALDGLLQSFSAWSVASTSLSDRQAVLDSAEQVVQAFRNAATVLNAEAAQSEAAIDSTVADINRLAAEIRDYNVERRQAGIEDAGASARVYAAMEELAGLADISVLHQDDGSFTVLLGGQTPLVVGGNVYAIMAGAAPADDAVYPSSRPPVRILGQDGSDLTGTIQSGRLAAQLDVHNAYLPSLIGDAFQPGALNTLAKAFAGRVNSVLESGWISAGPPPQPGVALFTYDAANDSAVARTLAVNSAITADQLAAIDPGPPYSANGLAITLANLGDSSLAANQAEGLGFLDYYSKVAASAGREIAKARQDASTQRQTTVQFRNLRDRISGVSLNEEAVMLMEFQRAYEAASRIIGVLDELTQTVLNLI